MTRINLSGGGALDVYLPDRCNGRAVLIIPGGGYYLVADDVEGRPVAAAFCGQNFAAFVLHYSVASDGGQGFPLPLIQAAEAMRCIRDNAARFGIAHNDVTVCGFSAGGHLAGLLGTLFDSAYVRKIGSAEQLRPNAMILCYPVVSGVKFCHKGSFRLLLRGAGAEEKRLKRELSLEKLVTLRTPPAFVWHTAADRGVDCRNSLLLAAALCKNNVPVELHVYPEGRHGLSLATIASAGGDETLIDDVAAQWFDAAVKFIIRGKEYNGELRLFPLRARNGRIHAARER